MSFFERIAPWVMHNLGTLLFGVIWITITVAAAICVVWAVGRLSDPTSQKAQRHPTNLILTSRQAWTPGAVVALVLLAVFLASYIVLILTWEDFAYYDNSFFNISTLKGHNLQPEIWPEGGRFCPLGLQEFNLIRHFTDTITGYHIIPIAQLLIFSWILLIIDDELNIHVRAALVILSLLTPSIVVSFNGLNFQERDVLFFLACLMLSIKRFEQTQSITWAVAAVVCAQIMIYCKETAFLLLLGFAASRLILRYRNADLAEWSYDRRWVRESLSRSVPCFFSCIILGLIFRIHGYSRKYKLRGFSPAATDRYCARLPNSRFAALANGSRPAGKDLFDPTPSGSAIAVVGWIGLWRRGLLPCLSLSQYIWCLLPGTGRPYRSAVCRSVCGAVRKKDALLGQGDSNAAGTYYPVSRCFGFSFCCIRAKERHSRKGGNSIGGENTISVRCRKKSQALLSVCRRLRDHGIWRLS